MGNKRRYPPHLLRPRDAKEIHGTWWFLPWHRAYLHATEQNLQKALGDPNVALPYWHWPLTPHVPEVYKTGSLDHTPRDPYIPIEPWRLDLDGMEAPSFRGRVGRTPVSRSNWHFADIQPKVSRPVPWRVSRTQLSTMLSGETWEIWREQQKIRSSSPTMPTLIGSGSSGARPATAPTQ